MSIFYFLKQFGSKPGVTCYHRVLIFYPFPNKPWFLPVCRTSPLKTLLEMEKLLITSNFSFSHSVFYPFLELSAIFIKRKIVVCKRFELGTVENLSFGKGLMSLKNAAVENIVEKGENAVHQYFLSFPQCFQKLYFSLTSVFSFFHSVFIPPKTNFNF